MSARRWLVLAVVVVVLGCTAAYGGYRLWNRLHVEQVELAGAVVQDLEVAGEDARIVTSATQSEAGKLALVLHGYRSDERVVQEPYMAAFTQALVDAGWVVAASEAHGDAWGSGESQAAHVALYEHVAAAYDVEETVIVSVSMGAVSGLKIVEDHAVPNLSGWVGVNPVTDLEAMAATSSWDDKIHGALSGPEIVELNPLNRDNLKVPLTVYASSEDTVTPAEVHAVPFVEKFGADLIECAGGHVAPDCFRAQDLIRR